MYSLGTITDKSVMTQGGLSGPGLSAEMAEETDRVETWATEMNDSGPDYCEHRLFRKDTVSPFKIIRVEGY